ncbi:hypothetical protein F5B21DRAFT_529381 [Xylaria acuta]|nr:hypothetical protein F5B21DRAFT_529381 [Xylaria acuta]
MATNTDRIERLEALVMELFMRLRIETPPEIPSEGNQNGHESGERESHESDTETPETPATTETPGTIDTSAITDIGTWWELSKYLTAYHPSAFEEDDQPFVNLHLTCDICQEKRLRLPIWVDEQAYLGEDRDSEDLCVLPCGHFFGHHCIKQWVDQERQIEDGPPDCPKCRFPLLYPECGHPIKLRALRDLEDFEPEDMPILVPNTRLHVLDDDGKTLVDISNEDPEESDARHNFGVPANCRHCEKQKLIEAWEQRHRDHPTW